jgi:hypothetical protein
MSAVYSGGVAFSYFPTNDAVSFGMVTVDGSTVTTSDDFTNLATALTAVTVLTTPAQGTATTPAIPDCPAASTDWLASTAVSTRSLFSPRLLKHHFLSFPQLLIKPNVTVSGGRLLASSHPKPSINLLFTKSYSRPVARYLARMEVLARPLLKTGLLVPTELCHPAMEASAILAGNYITNCSLSEQADLDLLSVLLGYQR